MTPAELLKIMSNSIVTTSNLKNAKVRGQPELVAFKLVTSFKGQKPGGAAVPVYALVNTDNQSSGFDAYICDYEQGSTKYAVLGNNADFMFTITMNGCTFGIGMPAPSGEVIVCHSNTSKGFGGKTPARRAGAAPAFRGRAGSAPGRPRSGARQLPDHRQGAVHHLRPPPQRRVGILDAHLPLFRQPDLHGGNDDADQRRPVRARAGLVDLTDSALSASRAAAGRGLPPSA